MGQSVVECFTMSSCMFTIIQTTCRDQIVLISSPRTYLALCLKSIQMFLLAMTDNLSNLLGSQGDSVGGQTYRTN
jgi:hypothetical protein